MAWLVSNKHVASEHQIQSTNPNPITSLAPGEWLSKDKHFASLIDPHLISICTQMVDK
jgi:hypothetical protein